MQDINVDKAKAATASDVSAAVHPESTNNASNETI